MEIVKQSELWSSLGGHGYYVFTLVVCVFTLIVKPGIVKFLLKFDLEGLVKVNHSPKQ